MSTTLANEQPEKRRTELENELVFLEQKAQAVKEEMRRLDAALTAKLEEKVKARRAALAAMESQKKELERKLKEMEDKPQTSSTPKDLTFETLEKKEEQPLALRLCQHCGCENIPSAAFCEKCGTKIEIECSAPRPL